MNPTALVAGNNTLNGQLHCYPNCPYLTFRPSARDCVSAIRSLPSGNTHGTFHNSIIGDDQFRLPVSKSYGPCEVLVEVKSLSPNGGTWRRLSLAATQLATACADSDGYLARRGGWTDAGDHDKIRITLQGVRQVLDRVGNKRIVGEEA